MHIFVVQGLCFFVYSSAVIQAGSVRILNLNSEFARITVHEQWQPTWLISPSRVWSHCCRNCKLSTWHRNTEVNLSFPLSLFGGHLIEFVLGSMKSRNSLGRSVSSSGLNAQAQTRSSLSSLNDITMVTVPEGARGVWNATLQQRWAERVRWGVGSTALSWSRWAMEMGLERWKLYCEIILARECKR